FGAGRRFARNLGFAVAVEVVDRELRVVRASANVRAQIDAKEAGAGQGVAVDEYVVGHAVVRVVLRVRRIPVQDDVELPVAIEIPDAGVVGVVSATVGSSRGR